MNKNLLDQMLKLRALVFKERLDWEVEVNDGQERDIFDDQDPLYLLSVDECNNLLGSLRLLPTTGPNMLRDVFSELTPNGRIASPLIWESSRFCTNPKFSMNDGQLVSSIRENYSAE